MTVLMKITDIFIEIRLVLKSEVFWNKCNNNQELTKLQEKQILRPDWLIQRRLPA